MLIDCFFKFVAHGWSSWRDYDPVRSHAFCFRSRCDWRISVHQCWRPRPFWFVSQSDYFFFFFYSDLDSNYLKYSEPPSPEFRLIIIFPWFFLSASPPATKQQTYDLIFIFYFFLFYRCQKCFYLFISNFITVGSGSANLASGSGTLPCIKRQRWQHSKNRGWGQLDKGQIIVCPRCQLGFAFLDAKNYSKKENNFETWTLLRRKCFFPKKLKPKTPVLEGEQNLLWYYHIRYLFFKENSACKKAKFY